MAKAKALIKKSGITTPVSVNMAVQEGNSTDQQIATIAAGVVVRSSGINVHIQTMSRELPTSTRSSSHKVAVVRPPRRPRRDRRLGTTSLTT